MKKVTKQFLLSVAIGLCLVSPVAAEVVEGLHAPWDRLLKKYVHRGQVDYKGLSGERHILERYLDALAEVSGTFSSRQEALAFWINAYNAFTVKLILDFYPVKSIRDIKKPWKRRFCKVAGELLSLDEIEHDKLRRQLAEPRIHFVIVCAAKGCPDLQPFAFKTKRLEDRLDLATRRFLASKKHFYVQETGGQTTVFISKIFDWFGGDFGKDTRQRLTYILPYLDPKIAQKIQNATSLTVSYLDYDWQLNEKNN